MRALNDFVIIKPDPKELIEDRNSGLTKEVVDSLRKGTLVVPENCENAVNKFPTTGIIVSIGPLCNKFNGLKVGMRINFGAYAYSKEMINNEQYLCIKDGELTFVP